MRISLLYGIPMGRLFDEFDASDIRLLAEYDRRFGLPDAWRTAESKAVINLHNAFAGRSGRMEFPVETPKLTTDSAKAQLKALAKRHARA